MTAHLNLVNVPAENTETTVQWKCSACGSFSNFALEGLGTPFASTTTYPEDIDTYIGGVCVPAPIYIPKLTFYSYFTDDEVVDIMDSLDGNVRAAVFRFNQIPEKEFPINHPLVRNTLMYFESLGLLAVGRTDIIIDACLAS